VVHILGEVQRPGEYRVADHTDVLELIAQVKSRVAAATGVALEEEVILWTGDPS